jgi:hypothetical protein
MRLRFALLAAAALATALGTYLALGRWGAGGNATLSALAGALQQGEELAPHLEAGRRRDDAKRALAAEVVAGRMTLRDAAGSFRRLDEANPGFPRPSADERALQDRVLDCAWEVALAGTSGFEGESPGSPFPRTDVPPGGRRPLCPRAG